MPDDLYPSLVGTADGLMAFEHGLLALAVRRAEPMLAVSGLPGAIVERPGQLRELTSRAIMTGRAIRSTGRRGEVLPAEAIRAATDFMDGVAVAYSPNAAADLGDWLNCLHLDRNQRNLLFSWASVFQLAAAARPSTSHVSDLAPAVRQLLVDSAEAAFGPAAHADLFGAITAASRIPLTDHEERLLAMEVSRVGDVDQWDVIQDMELNATMSRARKTRAKLKKQLTPAHFRTVVDWARQLMERRGNAFGATLLASDRDCGAAATSDILNSARC
jgi:hypothetical protein